MSRALGMHWLGDRVHYALVEVSSHGEPTLLAVGECPPADLPALHRKLSGEGPLLPWGVAHSREGHLETFLPESFPRLRPARGALLHPADAAAHWEWCRGRIEHADLYLLLRPEALLWSCGPPGHARAGLRPRRVPLRELLPEALRAGPREKGQVLLRVLAQGPGSDYLAEACRAEGLRLHLLVAPAEESGADPCAAGAALAALDPGLPGTHAARRRRTADPWSRGLFASGILLALTSLVPGRPAPGAPETATDTFSSSAPNPPTPSPAPPALLRLLQRRRALLSGLEEVLAAVGPSGLQEFEILTAPGGSGARLRALTPSPEAAARLRQRPDLSLDPPLPGGNPLLLLGNPVVADGTEALPPPNSGTDPAATWPEWIGEELGELPIPPALPELREALARWHWEPPFPGWEQLADPSWAAPARLELLRWCELAPGDDGVIDRLRLVREQDGSARFEVRAHGPQASILPWLAHLLQMPRDRGYLSDPRHLTLRTRGIEGGLSCDLAVRVISLRTLASGRREGGGTPR